MKNSIVFTLLLSTHLFSVSSIGFPDHANQREIATELEQECDHQVALWQNHLRMIAQDFVGWYVVPGATWTFAALGSSLLAFISDQVIFHASGESEFALHLCEPYFAQFSRFNTAMEASLSKALGFLLLVDLPLRYAYYRSHSKDLGDTCEIKSPESGQVIDDLIQDYQSVLQRAVLVFLFAVRAARNLNQ